MAASFKLRLLTAQRRGEVFGMEWKELDLDNAWWTIPSEKSKNGLAHWVPLSPPAVRILEDLKARSKSSQWVFPSPSGNKYMDAANAQKAIQRVRQRSGVDFKGHDLDCPGTP